MSEQLTRAAAIVAARPRPINWDELGSSAKDLWTDRQIASVVKHMCLAPACIVPSINHTHDGPHQVS